MCCIAPQPQPLPKIRSVRFGSHNETFSSPNIFSEIEKRQIWYQLDELLQIKTEIRATSTAIKKRKRIANSDKNVIDIPLEFCTRGLELKLDSDRKKRKSYANQIIIEAQRKMKASDLAKIASSLNRWATDRAVEDARMDAIVSAI